MKLAQILMTIVAATTLGFAPGFAQDASIGVKAPSPTPVATPPTIQYEVTRPSEDNYALGGARIIYDPAFLSAFSVPTETPNSTGRAGLAGWATPNAPVAGSVAGFKEINGTLVFASTALPPNIEPHMQGLDIWQKRKPLIYENLVVVDEALEPKPELAERWEQKSPTEYVFHLRRGVKFHSGKELDADDVKYTYDRVREPKVSPGANDLFSIKQIDVIDRHTVRFTLTAPVATFLINLAGKYNGVIPKGAAGDGKELFVKAIGTGPFAVAEFDPSRRLTLKRHLAYWGAQKPLLDEIVFQAIPDESSVVAGLRTGQVAMAEFSSALNYQVARGIATLDTVQAPSTRWVVLDLAGDQEPTSRLEVRQAIALAIDRAAILQIAGSGLGQRLGVLPQIGRASCRERV